MKELVNRIVFGTNLKFTLLIVLAIVFTAAFVCESGGDKVPPDAELQSLVKETTADFANAIETEDFAKLYAKASSDFTSEASVKRGGGSVKCCSFRITRRSTCSPLSMTGRIASSSSPSFFSSVPSW